MQEYKKALGDAVRNARLEHDLTQTALAEKLGLDVRTIINIENYRGNPKFEVLYALITELKIPADKIFYSKTGYDQSSLQPLLYELHDCSDEDVQTLLPAIRYLMKLINEK